MKVIVDHDLCQGHAMCELEAPDVFVVPKHEKVSVTDEHPPPALHDDVRRAVQYCPTRALSIVED